MHVTESLGRKKVVIRLHFIMLDKYKKRLKGNRFMNSRIIFSDAFVCYIFRVLLNVVFPVKLRHFI